MTLVKIKGNLFLLGLILLNLIVSPMLVFGLINTKPAIASDPYIIDDSNLWKNEVENLLKNGEYEENLPQIEEVSVFDRSLTEFLNKPLSLETELKTLKIITLFNMQTAKENRVSLIDSIFEDYELIYNYNIIPGICIETSAEELIEKANLLQSSTHIQKIYKTSQYENPVIIEEVLEPSTLSSSEYENWWVSAVGADTVGALDGTGVKVAVIDTGIFDHPDLNYNPSSTTARNFVAEDANPQNYYDKNGHGTHCAGIIGSNGGASGGKYRGIAPGVTLINARAGSEVGVLEDADIIAAIEWCVETAKVDIMSMSFGGGIPEAIDAITLAISNASDHGVISVVSAGNSGPDYFTGGSPAAGIDAISVGASDSENKLASFSSWGPANSYLAYVDVVAPGVNIISTEAPNSVISTEKSFYGDYFDYSGNADYIPLSGTSMAAPVVSGALALLKQKFPFLTPETARAALLKGAAKLSDEDDANYIRSGAGLINITASLDYLDKINSTYGDVNQTAILSPNELPIEPFDLLNFLGDQMKYNITILSGMGNNYTIEIPSLPSGITATLDKSSINFINASVGFVGLDVKIEKNATLGHKNFILNLTSGGVSYDLLNFSLEVKLPEYNILMESFHGLNDMVINQTFDQIGYYEAMSDLTELNISIDYGRQYWTPDYNQDSDNSILTEERLAQYDLIILQNPILPYSPEELLAFVNYFNDGGNLLFLGTRYQEIASENINYLFTLLGADIQINEENIMSANYHTLGASIYSQSVTTFNSPTIFNGVNKFLWYYGNTFTVSSNADSIATLNGKTVAAAYNGSSENKGNLIAFGSTDWIHYNFDKSDYSSDHSTLLTNLMHYLLPKDPYSINIGLRSERIDNSQLNITVYVKNLTTNTPLSSGVLNSNLEVTIEHPAHLTDTVLMSSIVDGIAFNYTYDLPGADYKPFNITVNLTLGSIFYIKTSKILFYDSLSVPNINSLYSDDSSISRSSSTDINADLGIGSINRDVVSYISLYPNSFFNTHKTLNKTLPLTDYAGGVYSYNFDPSYSDPAGLAIYYVTVNWTTTNYTNPISPRRSFTIKNGNPTISESASYVDFGGNSVRIDNTHTDEQVTLYSTRQLDEIELSISASDNPNEDTDAELKVYVSLFIGSVIGNTLYLNLIPSVIEATTLSYNGDKHIGTITIPETMTYSTIEGLKEISTEATLTNGYVGIIYITAIDSEGGSPQTIEGNPNPTTIYIAISPAPEPFPIELLLIILAVILGGIALIIIVYNRAKKGGVDHRWEGYDS